MPNPYFALAGVLALVAAAAGGFVKGEQYAGAKADQAAMRQLTSALKERDAKQQQINELEQAAASREQARQEVVRNVYTEIPKIVTRPVYRNECIDGDGVQLLDRARAAANGARGADPGAPDDGSGAAARDPAHR